LDNKKLFKECTMKSFKTMAVIFSLAILAMFAYADDKPDLTAKDSVEVVSDTTVSMQSSEPAEKIVVYYFHGTKRCATCKKLEAYSEEAIKGKFQKELEDGRLEFLPVNYDDEENKHFIDDYKLYTKALVVCEFKDGQQVAWKNLDKIWEKVNDKDEYLEYVQNEIAPYLGQKVNE